jgi:transporter family protein
VARYDVAEPLTRPAFARLRRACLALPETSECTSETAFFKTAPTALEIAGAMRYNCGMGWLFYAFVSAVASALTAILAKIGIENVPTSAAVVIRTFVVLLLTGTLMVSLGEHRAIPSISRRSLVFLILSGVMTGVAWMAYFRALQIGRASRVAPIDKLSLPLTIILAAVVLNE